MKKRTRTKLFILFFILFLIITPLTIAYALGYKFNLSWPLRLDDIFQKTGILIINSNPINADVIIDNEPYNGSFSLWGRDEIVKTPSKIKNLKPGEYDIRLELNGYWSWQKKLKIESGQTTFAEDIVLFKNNLPQLIKTDATALIPDHTNGQLIIVNPEGSFLYDSKTEKISSLASSTSVELTWSNSNQKILDHKSLQIINTVTGEIINLSELTKQDAEIIHWDQENDEIIYYVKGGSIYKFNYKNKTTDKITEANQVVDYSVRSNLVSLIDYKNNAYSLKIFSPKDNEIINNINLPSSPAYKLIDQNQSELDLFDAENNILYLIDPTNKISPIIDILNDIKYFNWAEKQLLFANDYEIWLYDMETHNKTLLTRIGQKINSIGWHENNNYAFYVTETGINVIELDARERRNILEILNLPNITYPVLSKNADFIYFTTQIGSMQGLYKLAL